MRNWKVAPASAGVFAAPLNANKHYTQQLFENYLQRLLIWMPLLNRNKDDDSSTGFRRHRVHRFGANSHTCIPPDAAIVGGSSRNWAGKKASEALPFISAEQDFNLRTIEELKLDPQADLAFLALPHGESAGLIRPLLDAGLKVVDLSADVRLSNLETYEKWYGPHKAAELLGQAIYGLPEIHREAIRKARARGESGMLPHNGYLGDRPPVRSQ